MIKFILKLFACCVLVYSLVPIAKGMADWSTSFMLGGGGPAPNIPVGNQCLFGDFNGDGRIDIACETASGSGVWAVGTTYGGLSLGAGITTAVWSGTRGPGYPANWPSAPAPGFAVGAQCFTGDFDGNGKTDIACYAGTASWAIGLSTGADFVSYLWTGGVAPSTPIGNQCVPGDFNGDGRTDIACETASGTGAWAIALSTGTGWQTPTWVGTRGAGYPSQWPSAPAPGLPVGNQCVFGDFDGKGMTDIACYAQSNGNGTANWAVGLSTGSDFVSYLWVNGPDPGSPSNVGSQCISGDFDADGRLDIACETASGNGVWSVGLSTGAGWQLQSWTGIKAPSFPLAWPSAPAPGFPVSNQCFTGDFDGDGRTDMACYAGPGDWAIGLSTGSNFLSQLWTAGQNPGMPIGDKCVGSDLNGDGMEDMLCYPTVDPNGSWYGSFSTGRQ